jgi:hypothetical protein
MLWMLYPFFWVIPRVWIVCANVSEHSVCSIIIGCVRRENSSCSHELRIFVVHTTYEDGTNSVPKRHYINLPLNNPKEIQHMYFKCDICVTEI